MPDGMGPDGVGMEPAQPPGGGGTDPDEPAASPEPPEELPPAQPQPGFTFEHGVASGDPLATSVILWTRVTPSEQGPLSVDWVAATDPQLTQVAARGRFETDGSRDYTVKVDADGLQPGTTYYYEFFDSTRPEEVRSSLGRTRTLPTGTVDRVRLAVCSCSCLSCGYFNSYAHIAARADLDAVLHLGDYIYEYGPDTYQSVDERAHEPAKEITTLADYRMRYAQYRRDPDLAEAHRQHPFIAVWDDHEIANNSWSGGAENHMPEDGDWDTRRQAAHQAYAEWMPIREQQSEGLLLLERRFTFGDLADILMLDTRDQGREMQDSGNGEGRQLLGEMQEAWLLDQLSDSFSQGVGWRLLGQQVMIAQLELAGNPLNTDQWDGYRAARDRLFDHVEAEGIDNLVVLTGDIHTSWANDLARDPFGSGYDNSTGDGSIAVEIVVSSVTSPGLDALGAIGSGLVGLTHPHVRWVDMQKRGYVVLDIDPGRVAAEWYHAATVSQPNSDHSFAKGFTVASGAPHLVEMTSPTAPPSAVADLA